MDEVQAQYEAYPYPERDPRDEKTRLITGSPSHPLEIDHFLFQGKRDWSRPLRALVAGGGTGDGLIQLAALLAAAGRPYQITYIDLSTASRAVAEERAKVRGLGNITFVTGSLLAAADHGPFDYIDCCGVLHHLPNPQEGFDALAAALSPEGGLGLMVYAPLGRGGVYPLQAAFGTLFAGLSPKDRLAAAKAVFAGLSPAHPFNLNPNLVDHRQSDAGFYDLLLHSQDQAFTVTMLAEALDRAGLALVNFTQPALYDLTRLLPDGAGPTADLTRVQAMQVAEDLRGTIKTHIAYAVPKARAGAAQARPTDMSLVPHLKGIPAAKLAQHVAAKGQVPVSFQGGKANEPLPKSAARLIAGINGQRTLDQIRTGAGLDALAFVSQWRAVDRALSDWGLMLYATPVTAG